MKIERTEQDLLCVYMELVGLSVVRMEVLRNGVHQVLFPGLLRLTLWWKLLLLRHCCYPVLI